MDLHGTSARRRKGAFGEFVGVVVGWHVRIDQSYLWEEKYWRLEQMVQLRRK